MSVWKAIRYCENMVLKCLSNCEIMFVFCFKT